MEAYHNEFFDFSNLNFSFPFFPDFQDMDDVINETETTFEQSESKDYSTFYPMEKYQPDTLKISAYLAVFVIGMLLNIVLVVFIVLFKRFKSDVKYWYILQFCLAQTFFLMTLPFRASQEINNEWIFSSSLCTTNETFYHFGYYATALFVMVLSIDRCTQHLSSKSAEICRSSFGACFISVCVWVAALLMCAPTMLYSAKRGFEPTCKCIYRIPSEVLTPDAIDHCETPQDFFNRISADRPDEIATAIPVSLNPTTGPTTTTDTNIYADFLGEYIEYYNFYFGGPENTNSYNPFPVFGDYNELIKDYYENNGGETRSGNTVAENGQKSTSKLREKLLDLMAQAHCHYRNHGNEWTSFILFNFILMFLTPVLVSVMALTWEIFGLLRNINKEKKSLQDSFNIQRNCAIDTFNIAILLVFFIICWMPINIVHLVKLKGMNHTGLNEEQAAEYCDGVTKRTVHLSLTFSIFAPIIFISFLFVRKLKDRRGAEDIIEAASNTAEEVSTSSKL